jgi:hypothetical protein
MPLARQSSLPRSRQSPPAYGGVACADGENDVEKHFAALELLVSLGWRTIGAKQNEISSIACASTYRTRRAKPADRNPGGTQ